MEVIESCLVVLTAEELERKRMRWYMWYMY